MTSKNTTALTDLHRARGPRALPRRRASLLVEAETVTAIALRESQPVVLGRARPADVVLDERGLSRQHARLVWRGGALEVQDLGSTNGTWVNDARVERASLRPGDALRFGDVHAHLHLTRFDGEERAAAPERFAAALGEELERARAFHRPLAVIALRSENPERSPGWERALRPALRPVDRLAPFGDRVALLALPEVGRAALPAWAERLRAIEPSLALAAAVHPQHDGDPDGLIAAALDALRRARPEGPLAVAPDEAPAPAEPAPGGAIVVSPPMRALYELVARAARTKLPILVLGETGVGKELVARALHAKSPRGEGPFKALNCATIPTHLTESVLFGHERGAFTGATSRAAGVFEQADGGTVFLDEVGELPPQAQAALLRVLETKQLVRVGGAKDIEVDVRVVAATHRDLEAMVEEGTFRADLLYRLDALTLEVPPLRERVEDVAPLAEAFLARAAEQWETPARGFEEGVLDALRAFHWPGNVRQLKNVVERAAAMALGPRVGLADLPRDVAAAAPGGLEGAAPADLSGEGADAVRPLAERVEAFERGILRDALEQAGGNQSEAARLLRVPRRTLAHKVKRYGLA